MMDTPTSQKPLLLLLTLLLSTPFLLLLLLLLPGTTEAATLYTSADPIAQFDIHNFTETVMGSERGVAWAVEFYATWCGHCQRMAPAWVELARDIQGWRNVVKVGAVACSEPSNAPLCQYFNVWGFPTIRLFSANSTTSDKGHTYKGEKTAVGIRETIAQYVATNPLLQSQRRAQDLSVGVAEGTAVFVVAVDHRDQQQKRVAIQAVLDASAATDVVVGWLDYFASRAHGVWEVPSLQRVDDHGMLSEVPLTTVTRSSIRDAVYGYMHGNATTTEPPQPEDDQHKFSDASYSIPSGVHMQDLESGLYYSMYVEIGAAPVLDVDARTALHRHLSLMLKYIPYRDSIQLFLNRTLDWLEQQQNNITGEAWLQALDTLQDADAYIPDHIRWAGCIGTLPKYRGYPCSVWMSYHVLTVGAYLRGAGDPEFVPTAVLVTMRSYVEHFLGCRSCAGHFASVADDLEEEVINRYDGVLWLWRSHNKVNNRLQGDVTEDPNHPKVQFPIKEACADCRIGGSVDGLYDNETEWKIGKVIGYLTRFYDPFNIIDDSAGQGISETAIQYHGQPAGSIEHNIAWLGGGAQTTQMPVFNSTAELEVGRRAEVEVKSDEDEVQGRQLEDNAKDQHGEDQDEVQAQGMRRRLQQAWDQDEVQGTRRQQRQNRDQDRGQGTRRRQRQHTRQDQDGRRTRDHISAVSENREVEHRRESIVHRAPPSTTTQPSLKLDDKQALGGFDSESQPSGEDRYDPKSDEDRYGREESTDPYGTRGTSNPDRQDNSDPYNRQGYTDPRREQDGLDSYGRQHPYDRQDPDRNQDPDRSQDPDRNQDPYRSQASSNSRTGQDNSDPYGRQHPYGRQDPDRNQDPDRSQASSNSRTGQDISDPYGRQDPDRRHDNSQTNPVDRWYSRYMRGHAGISYEPTNPRSREQSETRRSNPKYPRGRDNSGPSVPVQGSSRNLAYVNSRPCVLRASEWTACSKSCDTGTSSRLTNHNTECEMRQETRVCLLRPCRARFPDWTMMDWGRQRCPQFGSTYRAAAPRSLQHGGCRTRVQKYWRYCGMCPTKCCYPDSTRTESMDMVCTGGHTAVVKIMTFDYCQCADTCPPNY